MREAILRTNDGASSAGERLRYCIDVDGYAATSSTRIFRIEQPIKLAAARRHAHRHRRLSYRFLFHFLRQRPEAMTRLMASACIGS